MIWGSPITAQPEVTLAMTVLLLPARAAATRSVMIAMVLSCRIRLGRLGG
jgi:hypothetical protein